MVYLKLEFGIANFYTMQYTIHSIWSDKKKYMAYFVTSFTLQKAYNFKTFNIQSKFSMYS